VAIPKGLETHEGATRILPVRLDQQLRRQLTAAGVLAQWFRKTYGQSLMKGCGVANACHPRMKSSMMHRNDDQITEALALLKESDSVELKLTVQDSDHRSAIMALDMDVLDAEFRQVVFFDTRDLKLNSSGVIVRARRIRKGGDSVIKLRPVIPADPPSKLRSSGSFSVEVDATPGSLICSGAVKGRAVNSDVQLVLMAKQPIRKLFSPEQRAFYKQYGPKGLDLDRLTPFGPINVAKLKFIPKSFKRSLVAEVWFYPDASRILELSTKCSSDEAFQVLAETRAFLRQRGISLTGEQGTKTRKALHYFSQLHNSQRR
jgi:hypothetical protein